MSLLMPCSWGIGSVGRAARLIDGFLVDVCASIHPTSSSSSSSSNIIRILHLMPFDAFPSKLTPPGFLLFAGSRLGTGSRSAYVGVSTGTGRALENPKVGRWIFLFGWPIFRGCVSFGECILPLDVICVIGVWITERLSTSFLKSKYFGWVAVNWANSFNGFCSICWICGPPDLYIYTIIYIYIYMLI